MEDCYTRKYISQLFYSNDFPGKDGSIKYYILENKKVTECDSSKHTLFFEGPFENKIVAKTNVEKDVEVSTVFLICDHSHEIEGPPILFETMIFGGKYDSKIIQRYETYEQAEEGHELVVKELRSKGKLQNFPEN